MHDAVVTEPTSEARTESASEAAPGHPRGSNGLPAVSEVAGSSAAPATLAELYQDTYPDMVRLAALLTGSPDAAHDVVQDAFVRVSGRWNRIDTPRAYLRTAVVNGSRSHHRSRVRDARRAQRLENDAHTETPARAPDGADALGQADALGRALDALPFRARSALILRFFEDLSEADTARVLGCRPGTVGSLVHRALAQLRGEIER